MKIAILLTGFLRTNQSLFKFLENNILTKYQCDLFCITWQQQENNRIIQPSDFYLYEKYLKNYKIESNEQYYANKKVFSPIIRKNDVFLTNERAVQHGTYWANRLIDQWKLVYEGYTLIENPQNYDIILRLRYDLRIEKMNILQSNSLVIPQDIGGWSFTDHMAYGPPSVMQIYCDLYNNIEKLYIEDNIDITHAVDMPKHYITKNKINFIIDDTITYGIQK